MSKGTTVGMMSMLFGIGASSVTGGIYEGRITGSLTDVHEQFDVPPGVVVGAPITLTYTFDSESPDRSPEHDTEGYYDLLSWSLEVGPEVITCLSDCQDTGVISVINDDYHEVLEFTYDMYWVNVGPSTEGWFEHRFIRFLFVDTTADVFSSDGLPTSLQLPEFDMTFMFAEWAYACLEGGCVWDLTGETQTLGIHLVPEPGTSLLLLASGLAVVSRKRFGTG